MTPTVYTVPAPSRGLCQCGCGEETRIATVNDRHKGLLKGRPLAYLKGHNLRAGFRGPDSPHWKGGRQKSSHGYILLQMPDGTRKYEHNHTAEQILGRTLRHIGRGHRHNEVVHHINGTKTDNRPGNLLVCTHEYHVELHARLEQSSDWPEFQPRINHPRGTSRVGKSGFKGVEQTKAGRWAAFIKLSGKRTRIGVFATPQEAARCYDAEAVRINGPDWITNQSMGLLK